MIKMSGTDTKSSEHDDHQKHDLIGTPFSVIESDPGVFTTLVRKLGISGLEVVELYAIEPWAVENLNPHGLIFCFLWRKDTHRAGDFEDPAAEQVWFANQLSDDSCASLAILNVLLNCPECNVGQDLIDFKTDTQKMSSVMKGLAISNSRFVRDAHNSLSRPADLRGALNAIATTTVEEHKASQSKINKPPPAKRRKITASINARVSQQKATASETQEEVYHFIGYVPAHGKVWELDGLKSGPLEVGELPEDSTAESWMDVVRPALRMKMEKYGGDAGGEANIRFNLLALVDDRYQVASDEYELLFRKKYRLEKRLDEQFSTSWREEFGADLDAAGGERGPTFSPDFGLRNLEQGRAILDMTSQDLKSSWAECQTKLLSAKMAVEDEFRSAKAANTDAIKRTHDYEPFIREFITCLHNEGLLDALI